MSINNGIDFKNCGRILSNKKLHTTVAYKKMNEFQTHCIGQRSQTPKSLYCVISYTWNSIIGGTNLWDEIKIIVSYGGEKTNRKSHKRILKSDGNVWSLDWAI